ncbi:MAG: S1C family serine protease, partial [Myxococcota bacterium]
GSRMVLTGAHVVAHATFLQVQRPERAERCTATVRYVSHDCDLALLEVQDRHFLRGLPIARLGELPDLRDKVSVLGFPIGGEELSVTEGVVSRIEVQRYQHSQRRLLAATIDAAINEGNSGGPVVKDGRVIGVAMQRLCGAAGVGDIVPAPLIRRFLQDARFGRTGHFPALGIEVQNLENAGLRHHLVSDSSRAGVLIARVAYGNSAWGVLAPRDVLLSIDHHTIASNGTIHYRRRHRTDLSVVLSEHRVGDPLALRFLRAGRLHRATLTLKPLLRLVPYCRHDEQPPFFIWGGLVFQPLSRDFLSTWEDWTSEAPTELLHLYRTGCLEPARQEVIVLSRVLADALTVGYAEMEYEVVERVNGHRPVDLRDLARHLESSTRFVEIATSCHNLLGFSVSDVRRHHEGILQRYRIPADRSWHFHNDKSGDHP